MFAPDWGGGSRSSFLRVGGAGELIDTVIFSMLIFEFTVHPPIWVHLILWLPLASVLTLAALRPFKGVMIAMQFHNKASEHRSDE